MRRVMSWGRLAAVPTLLLCLSPLAQAAPAAGCQPMVTVRTVPMTFTEDLSRDVRQVTALNQNSSLPLTQRSYGLGSTYAENRVTIEWKRQPQSQCPVLDIELGYQNTRVSIARELLEDRCAFDHVHEHEMTHVAIYRRWLEQSPERLKALFSQRFDELAALPTAQRNRATLNLALADFGQVRTQHDEFDSEAEYKGNETACNSFVPRLLERLEHEGRLP